MPTSELGFAPVLHQITPERVLFVYNTNKTGSEEVADYYQSKRQIPDENILGLSITVPVSSNSSIECESPITLETYLDEIEYPIKSALEELGASFSTDGTSPIWVIILGYGIPLYYEENDEKIAIASRLHSIGKSRIHQKSNFTYDRKIFKFFDQDDANGVYITAILDGPTVASVKKLIDRAIDVDNQNFITGSIHIDPYGKQDTTLQLQYQNDLLEFINEDSSNFGIDIVQTVEIDDPYQDPTILNLSGDSFYWGWFRETYSKQLFAKQNQRRIFLYNADDTSACSLHYYQDDSPFDSNGSDFWCNLAINVDFGYASCAGAIDDPGESGYLRPRPFFQALHQGATLGEAFLFASPYLEWKIILVGDPLTVVKFSVDLPKHQDVNFTLLPNDEVILRIKKQIEESLGWAKRESNKLLALRNYCLLTTDIIEEVNLLNPIATWEIQEGPTSQNDLYQSVTASFIKYIQQTTNLTLNSWLDNHNEKITQSFNDVISETGTETIEHIFDSGYWEFSFIYTHNLQTLENVFFEIGVFTDVELTNEVLNINSFYSTLGWKYESEPFIFTQLSDSGFSSNFSGRRLKYQSPEVNYLSSGEIYYIHWQAFDENEVNFSGASGTERIIISS